VEVFIAGVGRSCAFLLPGAGILAGTLSLDGLIGDGFSRDLCDETRRHVTMAARVLRETRR
jgi:hypothetical protein